MYINVGLLSRTREDSFSHICSSQLFIVFWCFYIFVYRVHHFYLGKSTFLKHIRISVNNKICISRKLYYCVYIKVSWWKPYLLFSNSVFQQSLAIVVLRLLFSSGIWRANCPQSTRTTQGRTEKETNNLASHFSIASLLIQLIRDNIILNLEGIF